MAAEHFFAKAWSLCFERFSQKIRDFVKNLLLITNDSTDSTKYLNLLFALQYFVFLQKDLVTFTTNKGWSLTLEERLILGKYREAPRIDYGVKHKASLLIMRI